MKIAWIVDAPLDRRTGGTIYDEIVVAGLRAGGADVDLRVARPGGARELVRELLRSESEVILGDELSFAELGLVFEHARFARRILLVHHLTCWEDELRGGPRARARHLESRVLRRADQIIATSDATRDRLRAEGCRTKIDVVRPGADRLSVLPRTSSSDTPNVPNVLFVGAITPRKRVLELVRAFAAADCNARLTLVGSRDRDRRYVTEVDAAIREQGKRVTSLGEVDEAELARHFAEADVFVLPSSLEGYGIAATEAIHARIPVIAARTPGLLEALAPCSDATIFVSDLDELAEALRSVTQDDALRATLGAAASGARTKLPSWAASIDAFHSLLTHGHRSAR